MASDAKSTTMSNNVAKMLVEITTDGIPKLHCPVCNKALVSLAGYVKHVKKHEPPGGFQCRYCEVCYCHEDLLQDHVKAEHHDVAASQDGERKTYVCNKCGAEYKYLESYKRHCNKCGPNKRTTKNNEKTEEETPSAGSSNSIRQVECKFCSTRFSCSSNLIKHQRSRPDTCGQEIFQANRKSFIDMEDTDGSNSKKKKPAPQRRGRKIEPSTSDQEFISESPPDTDSDDDIPLASRRKPQIQTAIQAQALKQEDGLSDSTEECPDFDPANSDDEQDVIQFLPLPAPAMEVKEEAVDEDGEFDYPDASLFVKAESAADIFSNEKDKLLDVLLSTDEGDGLKPFESLKVEHAGGGGILDEIATVPLTEHLETELIEEDVLDVRVDKTKRAGRAAKNNQNEKPKRKYRKRNAAKSPSSDEDDEMNSSPTPTKRVAKISKKELKERLKMMNKVEKSWKCPHCVKIYHIRKPYEKHLRDDHKLNEDDIKDIFKDVDTNAKLDEEVFKCKICSKIYLVEKRLETHMKVHGEDGSLTFKCPCYCNLFFASKELATEHAHQQHKELLYCEKCDKYMTGHDSLKNHEKNFHSKKEPRNLPRNLICDKCGKKFSGRTSLSDHVRSDCGRLPLYQCSECGKRLSTAGILKTHMLLHQAETPYQCDKCGKTFKVKAQYKSHLKTRHTDYKPYKCHLCPKEYPYRESLLTHMTVHTGIKRFLCNNCGKRFTCISNLQAHRKVHADTCGQLPLNAKATQYMGVQRGKLLMGAKPEAGMEYEETKTLIAQEVIDRDMPMAQELNFPSDGSTPLATVPLNYASSHLVQPIVFQTMQAKVRRED
ncbi:oocyte zinc finger protein XlCOF7.1 [Drosophila willistoni]|uniref:oocyte zinc finger protein XlCOF7.1 n=1 Tax=Drosophila willistoni TaxID=7260 RepID=UPI001F080A67|nr:oocyte zinc finger protein XlCOF7.1 [Drosophila willistoni]